MSIFMSEALNCSQILSGTWLEKYRFGWTSCKIFVVVFTVCLILSCPSGELLNDFGSMDFATMKTD